jgi:hypothetical protein
MRMALRQKPKFEKLDHRMIKNVLNQILLLR